MTSGVALIAESKRLLLTANSDLLELAEQIGRGERRGLDSETAAMLCAICRRIAQVVETEIDVRRPGAGA